MKRRPPIWREEAHQIRTLLREAGYETSARRFEISLNDDASQGAIDARLADARDGPSSAIALGLLDEIAALCPLEDRSRERRVFEGVTDGAIRKGLVLACRDAQIVDYHPHTLRYRRCSLWLAHGFETVFVKQWSGHSKASMLTDVYGHVVTDPAGDEWRAFWLDAYERQRRPKAPQSVVEPSPGVVPV